MLDRKAFNFYKSFYDVALLLPEADQLEFIMAICNSQFSGQIVEPKRKLAKLAFTSQLHSIKKQIDGYNYGKLINVKDNEPLEGKHKGKVSGKNKGKYIEPFIQDKEQYKEEVKDKEKEQEEEQGIKIINEKIKIRENVFISQSNLDKLYSEYLEHEVTWMLDKLNDYKASTGKKYKCDYSAINVWVKDALRKAKVDFIKENNTHNVRMQIIQNEINNTDWNNL